MICGWRRIVNNRVLAQLACRGFEALVLTAWLSGQATAQPARNLWEVEAHAGAAAAIASSSGTPALPGPGETFTTVVGLPSRRESSWYFGDGTVLLNQVSNVLGVGPRITPLDPVLQSSPERRSDVLFGGRVSRRISRRIAVELSVDYSRGALELPAAAVSGTDATSASFISAWRGVLATSVLFASPTVTSTVVSRSREGHQLFVVGSAVIDLTKPSKLTPFAIVGAGVAANIGDAPSLTLTGKYQFQFGGVIPVSESDTVAVRYAVPDRTFIAVFGGGFKYALSPRSGVRVDVRAHLGRRGIDTLVDAAPAVQTSTPGGTASLTNPSLQFASNPPFLNASSTLSGPAISGFRTFQGTGVQTQISFSAGWFWRF